MNKPQLIDGVQKIEQGLKGRNRVFTIGDAAALTGYAWPEAKEALDQLMQRYDCRLQVTENGDLLYDFGKTLHRRGERTWAEWWQGAKQSLWNTFVFVFKIWITLTLVVYFVIFLILLIAMIVAMMAGNNDNRGGGSSRGGSVDVSGGFEVLGEMFRSLFFWRTVTGGTYYDRDPYGYNYRRYESRPSVWGKRKKKKKGKNFVASVYDFVFGPPRVEAHPLANQKEVAAYLRENKGLIVMPEIVGLAGWNNPQAEDFFTEVITRYQGDSKISENKVLYGDFYELARSSSTDTDAQIEWYWDEYEPEYKLTGNTSGRNAGVVFMNLFNLAFASFILFGGLQNIEEIALQGQEWIVILLGAVPFTFSFLFFLVPILRSFQIAPKERKRHQENIRKRLMKVIYQSPKESLSQKEILDVANADSRLEKLTSQTSEPILRQLLQDFDGDLDNDEYGQPLYRFTRLRDEQNEARHLRAQRSEGKDLGNIVFDTHD